jgi:hypothetical protein
MSAVCCLLALLSGGEPGNPFHLVVERLLDTSPAGSESDEDEGGDLGKSVASAFPTRRSARRSSNSPSACRRLGRRSPGSGSASLSPPDLPVRSASEHAFRNGIGTPLRC